MQARVRLALPPAFGGDGSLREVRPRSVVWSRGRVTVREDATGAVAGADPIATLAAALAAAGDGAVAVGFAAYELAATLDPLVAVPAGVRSLPDAWWAVLAADARCGGAASPAGSFRCRGRFDASLGAEAFRAAVAAVREGIGAGEYYQVNVTRRWRTGFAGDPAGAFLALVGAAPPAYACYLEDRDQGWAVVCLSPELLLARRGEVVETRPIKGTRPRGPAGDAAADRELALSGKDAAELAMIVDLERNDLNRVCRPGSVTVTAASRPLATTDVVHREAVVVGRLGDGAGWSEILTAMLPGGSVTGAPKLAACRTIAELEPVPRSVYCGALGVLTASGDGTLALPIRTGYVTGGELCFHAGCGVVWDSEPAAEEAESRAKVRRWFAVLGG